MYIAEINIFNLINQKQYLRSVLAEDYLQFTVTKHNATNIDLSSLVNGLYFNIEFVTEETTYNSFHINPNRYN